jgi:hypothetical protein
MWIYNNNVCLPSKSYKHTVTCARLALKIPQRLHTVLFFYVFCCKQNLCMYCPVKGFKTQDWQRNSASTLHAVKPTCRVTICSMRPQLPVTCSTALLHRTPRPSSQHSTLPMHASHPTTTQGCRHHTRANQQLQPGTLSPGDLSSASQPTQLQGACHTNCTKIRAQHIFFRAAAHAPSECACVLPLQACTHAGTKVQYSVLHYALHPTLGHASI